jgi:hypothetical protein
MRLRRIYSCLTRRCKKSANDRMAFGTRAEVRQTSEQGRQALKEMAAV